MGVCLGVEVGLAVWHGESQAYKGSPEIVAPEKVVIVKEARASRGINHDSPPPSRTVPCLILIFGLHLLYSQPYSTRPRPASGTCLEAADGLYVDSSFTYTIDILPNFHPSRPTTMANATIDTPVVPILLVGDADVGKSAFLSYVYRCSLTPYLSSSYALPC